MNIRFFAFRVVVCIWFSWFVFMDEWMFGNRKRVDGLASRSCPGTLSRGFMAVVCAATQL